MEKTASEMTPEELFDHMVKKVETLEAEKRELQEKLDALNSKSGVVFSLFEDGKIKVNWDNAPKGATELWVPNNLRKLKDHPLYWANDNDQYYFNGRWISLHYAKFGHYVWLN